MGSSPTVDDVRKFWNENPLFSGEVDTENLEVFFTQHDKTYFEDVFRGIDYRDVFFLPSQSEETLDVGCGIGFWVALFSTTLGVENVTGVDLSRESLSLAQKRCPKVKLVEGNAENLDFDDESFDFVNCQGVVHHTPNTDTAVKEIYRILRDGGRASISVYYDNVPLKIAGKTIRFFGNPLSLFLKTLGRGRDFGVAKDKDDIVRLYDGSDNPIGKSYSKRSFEKILKDSGFAEIEFRYFFFPFRFLKFRVPDRLSRVLVKHIPFMIVANLRK